MLNRIFRQRRKGDMCQVTNSLAQARSRPGGPPRGKGFRVCLKGQPQVRKGIFCTGYQDLHIKIRERFKLKRGTKSEAPIIYTEDGTEVEDDDYLDSLPGHSVLFVAVDSRDRKQGQQTPENIFDKFLSLMRWSGEVDSTYKAVLEFMREDFVTKYREIQGSLDHLPDRTTCSTRKEDPDWFSDITTNSSTKEEFMFKNCQARIRGYLARAESQLRETKLLKTVRELETVDQLVGELRRRLKANMYHGNYFNRAGVKEDRICDGVGLFVCEGRFDQPSCGYPGHSINPYQSQEARILFSTWNLDHVVERSRSVVPGILDAVKSSTAKRKVNVDYFYSLLFTRTNLKLVHIVCHNKQEHRSAQCDKKKYFI